MLKNAIPKKNLLAALFALCFYATLSYLYFGIGVLSHFNTVVAGMIRPTFCDPLVYIWSLAWWPYALRHGLDPFRTNYAWYPYHYNLAQSALSPGIALIDLPITLLVGPIAAFNFQEIFNSTIAAFCTFILCRYLSKKNIPALISGVLFGFSSYMVAHSLAHINLTAIYCIPLYVYLIVRFCDNTLTSRIFTICFTLLLILQALLSLEILATFFFFGALTYLLAFLLLDNYQESLTACCKPILMSCVIAIIILTPYLLAYFATPVSTFIYPNSSKMANDLLGFVIPTPINIFANTFYPIVKHFSGNLYIQDGYLGIGLLLILTLFSIEFWYSWVCKILILMTFITAIASLGSFLYIAGKPISFMPGFLIALLPLVRFAIPGRFIIYTTLCLAIIVSLWLTRSKIKLHYKYLLVGFSLLLLLPCFNSHIRQWRTKPYTPAFIQQGLYKDYIKPNAIVMTLPTEMENNSMLWQVQTHFYYKMSLGYLGLRPLAAQKWTKLLNQLIHYAIHPVQRIAASPAFLARFKAFLCQHAVNVILVSREFDMWHSLLGQLDLTPIRVAGVQLYYVKFKAKHVH